ncbi:MAG: hypothetical protein HYX48_01595 [Chlamydiales bacterium]|nr:hypothetical protein [Chlamydiales bacterium]
MGMSFHGLYSFKIAESTGRMANQDFDTRWQEFSHRAWVGCRLQAVQSVALTELFFHGGLCLGTKTVRTFVYCCVKSAKNETLFEKSHADLAISAGVILYEAMCEQFKNVTGGRVYEAR